MEEQKLFLQKKRKLSGESLENEIKKDTIENKIIKEKENIIAKDKKDVNMEIEKEMDEEKLPLKEEESIK